MEPAHFRLSSVKPVEVAADVLCPKQQCDLSMQAADLLAIDEHVQDVCTELATRMFDAKATPDTTGIQEFQRQVFLNATLPSFDPLVGATL
jgi:hypothetical protein